jgi:hypothetical protein
MREPRFPGMATQEFYVRNGLDPILQRYTNAVRENRDAAFFDTPLDRLFAEHSFNVSRPPFSFGEHRPA